MENFMVDDAKGRKKGGETRGKNILTTLRGRAAHEYHCFQYKSKSSNHRLNLLRGRWSYVEGVS